MCLYLSLKKVEIVSEKLEKNVKNNLILYHEFEIMNPLAECYRPHFTMHWCTVFRDMSCLWFRNVPVALQTIYSCRATCITKCSTECNQDHISHQQGAYATYKFQMYILHMIIIDMSLCFIGLHIKIMQYIFYWRQQDFNTYTVDVNCQLVMTCHRPHHPGDHPIRVRGKVQSGQDWLTAVLSCHGKCSQSVLDHVVKSS